MQKIRLVTSYRCLLLWSRKEFPPLISVHSSARGPGQELGHFKKKRLLLRGDHAEMSLQQGRIIRRKTQKGKTVIMAFKFSLLRENQCMCVYVCVCVCVK
jgi:hypothetical protein